jgi:hypothetical protein
MTAHNGREAVRWGRRALELAERVRAPEAQLMALNAIGMAQLECFEQLEGVEALERAVRLAREHGDDRGRIRVRRGDPEGDSYLEEVWALSRDTGDLAWIWPVSAGRAEAAWLAGRQVEIRQLVEPAYEQACKAGLRWGIGDLGSWVVRSGALERLPDGVGAPFGLPWREAAEAWRQLGCPYEQAEALADGDEPAMRESLAILTRLGAEPAADRLRRSSPGGASRFSRSSSAG